jgi:hypothetical protein
LNSILSKSKKVEKGGGKSQSQMLANDKKTKNFIAQQQIEKTNIQQNYPQTEWKKNSEIA